MSYKYAKFKENPCVGTYVSTPFVKLYPFLFKIQSRNEIQISSAIIQLQIGEENTEYNPNIALVNFKAYTKLCLFLRY